MYWLRVLWAIVRGVAAGISADWDEFVAREYGKKQGPSPRSEQAPAGPFTGPVAPSEPAEGVRVDTERKEGQFTGLPYMGESFDPRVRPAQAQTAPRDGESRRKRRSRPAAPTPTEFVCARCKAALDGELQAADAAGLAIAQEVPQDDAAAGSGAGQPAINVPNDDVAGPGGDAAECVETRGNDGESVTPAVPDAARPALADRLVTRLGTRGSLMRLSEAHASLANNAMGG